MAEAIEPMPMTLSGMRRGIAAGLVIIGLLGAAVAFGQRRPATEAEALSYILSAFLSQADPGVLSPRVTLGPELEQRLALAPGAGSAQVYQALVTLTGNKPVNVRKATPSEISDYGSRRGFEPGLHPLYALEAAELKLLLQYDHRAIHIHFVGQLGVPDPSPRPLTTMRSVEQPKPVAAKLAWTAQFDYKSATLTPEAISLLEEGVIPKAISLANVRFQISAHTDRIGSARYNRQLAEKRARAVLAYLVAKGVDAGKIKLLRYGESAPLKACPEEKERRTLIECLAPNRRVVVEVLSATP